MPVKETEKELSNRKKPGNVVSQNEGNQSVSDGADPSNQMRSNMPSIRISNKVIGDPGENIFSEVVGGGSREQ